jgi:hypothetical protein
MSGPSAEQFIGGLSAAFNEEGIRAVARDFWDAEVEYHDDPAWPGGGAHTGRDAVVARFEEVVDVLGITHLAVQRVVDNGELIAWVTRASGQTPGGDVPNYHVWGYVGRLAGAKLVYFGAYYDAEEALQAVAAQR